jgi:hypothetical protein
LWKVAKGIPAYFGNFLLWYFEISGKKYKPIAVIPHQIVRLGEWG